MDSKEIIFELLEKEMLNLKKEGYDRACDFNGRDRFETEEFKRKQTIGFNKFSKYGKLKKLISENHKIKDIYEEMPGWISDLNELIKKSINELDKSNDTDKIASLETLKNRLNTLEQGKNMKEKLVQKHARGKKSMDYFGH